ncbi:MAG: PIN domain-containing protein [Gammaproteobacteria bacterium]|nr:PIN domain-containing protein [Gammaproteobacteria bacterium]MCY4322775.1 PIN domain-containing protein [Gammaproteobacteria bacterium]
MILTDAGPLVALFDRSDSYHESTSATLRRISEPLASTLPALTEAFYLLGAGSSRTSALTDFVSNDGLRVLFLDPPRLSRAFELMQQYADLPMDFADATLVSMAESLGTQKVFTLDRGDFSVYRIKKGYRHLPFEVIG